MANPKMNSNTNPKRLGSQGGSTSAHTQSVGTAKVPSKVQNAPLVKQALRKGGTRQPIAGKGQGPNRGDSLPSKSLGK